MIPLLAVEVDNNALMGTLLVGLVLAGAGLIGAMATIKGWIREVAGVKETSLTEISGQPLKVEMAKQFMTRDDHRHICGGLEKRVGDLETDMRGIKHQMATETKEILKAGHDRAEKIYDRINSIDRKVSALDERTDTTNSSMDIQAKKIDRILERLKA